MRVLKFLKFLFLSFNNKCMFKFFLKCDRWFKTLNKVPFLKKKILKDKDILFNLENLPKKYRFLKDNG